MFDEHTELHVSTVQEVHVSWVKSDSTCGHFSCHPEIWDGDALLKLTADVSGTRHLVTLEVAVEYNFSVAQLNSAVEQILRRGTRLQALQLGNEVPTEDAVCVVLDKDHGVCLRKLCLKGKSCNVLDFSQTTCLTSIELVDVYGKRKGRNRFTVSLPANLQSLHVFGGNLFQPVNRLQLQHCTALH